LLCFSLLDLLSLLEQRPLPPSLLPLPLFILLFPYPL
jgi:hypothetical protein